MSAPLKPDQQHQLDGYLAALADGDLPAEDATQLQKLVLEHPAALWRYVQAMHLYSALKWRFGSVADVPEASAKDRAEPQDGEVTLSPSNAADGRSHGRRTLARAAVLLVGATAALWAGIAFFSLPKQGDQVEVANVPTVPPASDTFIAIVDLISADCQWGAAKWRLTEGERLEPGQQIRITRGQVRLSFEQGAQVVINGPAAFIVTTTNSGRLILGGLTAQVPERASGFRVDTPHGKVIDLGTEFGLIVDDFGSSEVGVFKGKVLTHASQSDDPVELDAGESLLWDLSSARRSQVRPHRFDQRTSYSGFLHNNASAILVQEDDFDGPELNQDLWKTLGHVSQKNGKLQLGRDQSEPVRGNVPYLLSVCQLDPADGAVVVTGTISFSDPLHPESGALSVFTRAEDERGNIPRPDYAMLATGIRSTFWPVSSAVGETLRVLVRPHPEALNVGVLGEEFEASMDSSKWRFQVIDDGVNLTLSVAQFDNPSVMKTVYARALFHGTENFVALEGDPNAVILLDDVKIFQIEKKSVNNPSSGS